MTTRAWIAAGLATLGIGGIAVAVGVALKTPTYSGEVAAILNSRCVSCHSESRVAPFSLVGYERAKRYSEMIALVTSKRIMPPWKAEPGYGKFRDVAALSDAELRTLAEWAKAGAPQGDPNAAPATPKIAVGWRLGEPDLIVTPSKATKIPAEGGDFYRDYLIDPHIDKPTWVRAIEFRPGTKNTVHHIIPALLKREDAEKCRKIKFDHEDDSWEQKSLDKISTYNTLGMWSTGAEPFCSPDGTAFLINPGDCILLDVHYKTTGKKEVEQTQVGMFFLSQPPKHELKLKTVATGGIYLQPGEANVRFYAIRELEADSTIYAIWPHMHFLGRTFKAWLKYPAGYGKPLVAIKDWDPEWQLIYHLDKPIEVPAGTKVYVTGTFDNSKNNPRNPHPEPQIIESGPSSKDEMLLMDLYLVEKTPSGK